MQRGREVAFVEVKARRGDDFGGPLEAVHHCKRRELGRSAQVWMDRFGTDELAYRFDVVGVLISGQKVRIRHVENAFPLM
jgi:putative endonuclease